MALHHDRNSKQYFATAEASALVGKAVKTNAGTTITVASTFCEGTNRYSVADGKGNLYAKSCKNGLYIL